MRYLDLTLNTPAENLALDEALLDAAESGDGPDEVVRVWEPTELMVVAGRSTRLGLEIDQEACQRDKIPVLRRSSGGATIVTGPGCLMYAVVLSYQQRPELRALDQAHSFVLGQLSSALADQLPSISLQGTSDLALVSSQDPASADQGAIGSNREFSPLKFSGNSLRCKRTHFLYHGTLLYDFPLDLVGRYLLLPPRQPDYRKQREHSQFVTNLPLSAATLRQSVFKAFAGDAFSATAMGSDRRTSEWPREIVAKLVAERYSQDNWTQQFP